MIQNLFRLLMNWVARRFNHEDISIDPNEDIVRCDIHDSGDSGVRTFIGSRNFDWVGRSATVEEENGREDVERSYSETGLVRGEYFAFPVTAERVLGEVEEAGVEGDHTPDIRAGGVSGEEPSGRVSVRLKGSASRRDTDVGGREQGIGEVIAKDLKNRDHKLVELLLPAHLQLDMVGHVKKGGWEFRDDYVKYLENSVSSVLNGVDELTISRVAKRVVDIGNHMIRATGTDEPRECLMICAMFTAKIVDELLYPDPTNVAVVGSLLLLDEYECDAEFWPGTKHILESKASSMLVSARLMGYYTKEIETVPLVASN